jgi:hypothetical protein
MSSIEDPQTLAELVQRLEALRADAPRRWGTLTPGEMLCHLGDAATRVLARPAEPAAPLRRLRKWVALRSPLPWPRGARTAPTIDPRAEGTRPTDFEHDRRRAIAALQAVAQASSGQLHGAHALFGRMNPSDWKRWAFRHTDHHLRQFGA